MTLNLKSVAFVPYVGQFSVICMVVLACFGTFVRRRRRRRLIRRKEPHVDLRAAGKKVTDSVRMLSERSSITYEH